MADAPAINLNLKHNEPTPAEKAVEKAEQGQVSKSEAQRLTAMQKQFLESLEAKTVIGARVRTPKEQLLDLSALEEAMPEAHLRWLNLSDRDKVVARQAEGYTRVPTELGGKSLGDSMAVFAIPKRAAEQKVARIEERNKALSTQQRNEVYAAAESVARELRDKHNIKVDVDRIFKEG